MSSINTIGVGAGRGERITSKLNQQIFIKCLGLETEMSLSESSLHRALREEQMQYQASRTISH